MMKNVLAVIAAVVVMLGAAPLAAQEEALIKKVIPDAMGALAGFQFDKAWSAWCDDGFVVRDGVKSTIPDMQKSGKYAKLVELAAMRNAKSLEELAELMVKSGDMTQKQKETLLASPEDEKKANYHAMRQAVRMQCMMAQMGIRAMSNVQYKSITVEGGTAVAQVVANNPMLGSGDLKITYKKIKNVWKVYSVEEIKQEEK